MVPKLFSTLVAKDRVPIEVAIGEDRFAVAVPRTGGHVAPDGEDFAPAATHDLLDAVRVPLIKLALARSGDQGDHANIGVIARKPEYLPWRSEEHTSDLQSLMRISYAAFCLKKNN